MATRFASCTLGVELFDFETPAAAARATEALVPATVEELELLAPSMELKLVPDPVPPAAGAVRAGGVLVAPPPGVPCPPDAGVWPSS